MARTEGNESEGMTSGGPTGVTGATGATGVTGAMDEEEMMNAPPGLADTEEGRSIGLESNGAAPITMDGLVVGSDGKVLEPEGPRHRPREPLVSALQDFTTVSRGRRRPGCGVCPSVPFLGLTPTPPPPHPKLKCLVLLLTPPFA